MADTQIDLTSTHQQKLVTTIGNDGNNTPRSYTTCPRQRHMVDITTLDVLSREDGKSTWSGKNNL